MLDTETMYKRIFWGKKCVCVCGGGGGGGGRLHNFTIADFHDHLLVCGRSDVSDASLVTAV